MTDGRAKEPAAFVGHIEKPTRPAFRTALGVDQVAHDGQRLIASRGSTRQLDPFLVRQHALTEAEMEEIARHDAISTLNPQARSSRPRPQDSISFHLRT